jgi:hypothetical protein
VRGRHQGVSQQILTDDRVFLVLEQICQDLLTDPLVGGDAQVAGWSFRGLKPWQAGADEIGEIRGITRLNGSFVNQGPGFKLPKRQVTR